MNFPNARSPVLLAVILLSSCSSHKPMNNSPKPSAPASPVSLVGTEWILTDLAGTPVVPDSKASLSFLEGGRAAGNASCNRFTGGVTLTGNTIKFGQMASTRMACVDAAVNGQESEYLKLLGTANRYEVRDNLLLIYADGAEKPLRFARQASPQP